MFIEKFELLTEIFYWELNVYLPFYFVNFQKISLSIEAPLSLLLFLSLSSYLRNKQCNWLRRRGERRGITKIVIFLEVLLTLCVSSLQGEEETLWSRVRWNKRFCAALSTMTARALS